MDYGFNIGREIIGGLRHRPTGPGAADMTGLRATPLGGVTPEITSLPYTTYPLVSDTVTFGRSTSSVELYSHSFTTSRTVKVNFTGTITVKPLFPDGEGGYLLTGCVLWTIRNLAAPSVNVARGVITVPLVPYPLTYTGAIGTGLTTLPPGAYVLTLSAQQDETHFSLRHLSTSMTRTYYLPTQVFPWPQLIPLKHGAMLATGDGLFDLDSETLVEVDAQIDHSGLWHVADFGGSIYAANGAGLLKKERRPRYMFTVLSYGIVAGDCIFIAMGAQDPVRLEAVVYNATPDSFQFAVGHGIGPDHTTAVNLAARINALAQTSLAGCVATSDGTVVTVTCREAITAVASDGDEDKVVITLFDTSCAYGWTWTAGDTESVANHMDIRAVGVYLDGSGKPVFTYSAAAGIGNEKSVPLPMSATEAFCLSLGRVGVIYGSDAVLGFRYEQTGDGLLNYGFEPIPAIPGTAGRAPAVCIGDRYHIAQDAQGCLWRINSDFSVIELGYAEFLSPGSILTADQRNREVWIASAAGSYVLSENPASPTGHSLGGPMQHKPNGFTDGLSSTGAGGPQSVISYTGGKMDMGSRGIKTVTSAHVQSQGLTGLTTCVLGRVDTVSAMAARSQVTPCAPSGVSYPTASFVDGQVRINGNCIPGTDGSLSDVELRYIPSDKRPRRGPIGQPEQAQAAG